jgi:hypothetical protein
LRRKSEWAGAVTLRVKGVAGSAVSAKLYQVSLVNRVTVVEEKENRVTVSVFPKPAATDANGEFARAISEAAHGWHIEQLKIEEGRLDEVFRALRCRTRAGSEENAAKGNIKAIAKRELTVTACPWRMCSS